MSLIEGTNLRKTYRLSRRTSVEALRGVDIRIAPGEMVAIMGPSGSGKSTLMHILGLLHAPDREEPMPSLRIDGADAATLSDRERTRIRAQWMGFVFQSFNLVPTLTAGENVVLAAEYAGIARGARSVAAREALDSVGMADRAGHRPMELSGGEQQRVAIARALLTAPAVLFADEPTGSLDSRSGEQVLRLLRDVVDQRRQTVVMVTHDAHAASVADRIVVLSDGRVVHDGHGESTEGVLDLMKAVA